MPFTMIRKSGQNPRNSTLTDSLLKKRPNTDLMIGYHLEQDRECALLSGLLCLKWRLQRLIFWGGTAFWEALIPRWGHFHSLGLGHCKSICAGDYRRIRESVTWVFFSCTENVSVWNYLFFLSHTQVVFKVVYRPSAWQKTDDFFTTYLAPKPAQIM